MLVVGMVMGQWDDTLCVYKCGPDTLVARHAMYGPRPLFLDAQTDRVYITEGDDYPYRLYALDCVTDSIVDSLDFGVCVPLVFDSVNAKVFGHEYDYQGDFVVLDLNQRARRWLCWDPGATKLCWSPRSNKVYVPSVRTNTVLVFHCGTESLLTELDVNPYTRVALNPVHDKYYAVDRFDSTFIFDVATDSLLARIRRPTHNEESPMWNPYDSMVYLFSDSVVWKVDGEADSIVDSIVGSFGRNGRLCHNVRDNMLYVLERYWHIKAINLNTGEVLSSVPGFDANIAVYDSIDNRVYGIHDDIDGSRLTVFDCAENRILRTFYMPNINSWGLVWHPRLNKLYSGGNSMMRAVAEGQSTVRNRQPTATLARGELRLPGRQDADLLDIAGRKVMDLEPGDNDIRHLAPGVYFVITPSSYPSPPEGERMKERGVRSAVSGKLSAVRKVVIQK
jgi:DNA-binding beta-propeller fold protein YncE